MGSLFVGKKVERGIERLRQSGKQGQGVAQRAAAIIEALRCEDLLADPEIANKLTKYGEKRIRNCLKFDLGAGYRMIILWRDARVYVPFLGTHDECQRWLANHSRLRDLAAAEPMSFVSGKAKNNMPDAAQNFPMEGNGGAGDGFLRDLSEKELRAVFSGLVTGSREPRP